MYNINFYLVYKNKDNKTKKPLSDKTKLIEFFTDFDDNSIQKVLREIDSRDLAVALWGSSIKVIKKIVGNMSDRAANFLVDDIDFISPIAEDYIIECQIKLVNIVKKLEEQGEIIVNTQD